MMSLLFVYVVSVLFCTF